MGWLVDGLVGWLVGWLVVSGGQTLDPHLHRRQRGVGEAEDEEEAAEAEATRRHQVRGVLSGVMCEV